MATLMDYDLGMVMSGKASTSGKTIRGYDEVTPMVPAPRKNFMFPDWTRHIIMWWTHALPGQGLWITGPSGCGKTSVVKVIANRLKYPVWEVTGHNRLEMPNLVGHYALKDGSTVWVDGPLIAAMRAGGILIINEIDLLDPSIAAGMNTILDGSPFVIEDKGEVLVPAEGFRLIGTANTFGTGEGSDVYVGTLQQNAAFKNRFWKVMADYMPVAREKALIKLVAPSLDDTLIDHVMEVIGIIRKDSESFGNMPIGVRTSVSWARMLEAYAPMVGYENVVQLTFDMAVGYDQSMDVKAACTEIIQRVFG